jgi:Holliday junction resolvase
LRGALVAAAGRLIAERYRRGEPCTPLEEVARLAPWLGPGEVAPRLPGVELHGDQVCVSEPLELALALARLGVSEKEVAAILDWRMFEEYAARALEEAGYRVWRGLRPHGRGGFQVDVLGLDAYGRGVVFECKHWSPRSSAPSRLREAAQRHLERTRRLAAAWSRLGLPQPSRGARLLPALLVLRETGLPRLASGVPVVPVSRLRGFLEQIDYLLEDPGVAVIRLPGGAGRG